MARKHAALLVVALALLAVLPSVYAAYTIGQESSPLAAALPAAITGKIATHPTQQYALVCSNSRLYRLNYLDSTVSILDTAGATGLGVAPTCLGVVLNKAGTFAYVLQTTNLAIFATTTWDPTLTATVSPIAATQTSVVSGWTGGPSAPTGLGSITIDPADNIYIGVTAPLATTGQVYRIAAPNSATQAAATASDPAGAAWGTAPATALIALSTNGDFTTTTAATELYFGGGSANKVDKCTVNAAGVCQAAPAAYAAGYAASITGTLLDFEYDNLLNGLYSLEATKITSWLASNAVGTLAATTIAASHRLSAQRNTALFPDARVVVAQSGSGALVHHVFTAITNSITTPALTIDNAVIPLNGPQQQIIVYSAQTAYGWTNVAVSVASGGTVIGTAATACQIPAGEKECAFTYLPQQSVANTASTAVTQPTFTLAVTAGTGLGASSLVTGGTKALNTATNGQVAALNGVPGAHYDLHPFGSTGSVAEAFDAQAFTLHAFITQQRLIQAATGLVTDQTGTTVFFTSGLFIYKLVTLTGVVSQYSSAAAPSNLRAITFDGTSLFVVETASGIIYKVSASSGTPVALGAAFATHAGTFALAATQSAPATGVSARPTLFVLSGSGAVTASGAGLYSYPTAGATGALDAPTTGLLTPTQATLTGVLTLNPQSRLAVTPDGLHVFITGTVAGAGNQRIHRFTFTSAGPPAYTASSYILDTSDQTQAATGVLSIATTDSSTLYSATAGGQLVQWTTALVASSVIAAPTGVAAGSFNVIAIAPRGNAVASTGQLVALDTYSTTAGAPRHIDQVNTINFARVILTPTVTPSVNHGQNVGFGITAVYATPSGNSAVSAAPLDAGSSTAGLSFAPVCAGFATGNNGGPQPGTFKSFATSATPPVFAGTAGGTGAVSTAGQAGHAPTAAVPISCTFNSIQGRDFLRFSPTAATSAVTTVYPASVAVTGALPSIVYIGNTYSGTVAVTVPSGASLTTDLGRLVLTCPTTTYQIQQNGIDVTTGSFCLSTTATQSFSITVKNSAVVSSPATPVAGNACTWAHVAGGTTSSVGVLPGVFAPIAATVFSAATVQINARNTITIGGTVGTVAVTPSTTGATALPVAEGGSAISLTFAATTAVASTATITTVCSDMAATIGGGSTITTTAAVGTTTILFGNHPGYVWCTHSTGNDEFGRSPNNVFATTYWRVDPLALAPVQTVTASLSGTNYNIWQASASTQTAIVPPTATVTASLAVPVVPGFNVNEVTLDTATAGKTVTYTLGCDNAITVFTASAMLTFTSTTNSAQSLTFAVPTPAGTGASAVVTCSWTLGGNAADATYRFAVPSAFTFRIGTPVQLTAPTTFTPTSGSTYTVTLNTFAGTVNSDFSLPLNCEANKITSGASQSQTFNTNPAASTNLATNIVVNAALYSGATCTWGATTGTDRLHFIAPTSSVTLGTNPLTPGATTQTPTLTADSSVTIPSNGRVVAPVAQATSTTGVTFSISQPTTAFTLEVTYTFLCSTTGVGSPTITYTPSDATIRHKASNTANVNSVKVQVAAPTNAAAGGQVVTCTITQGGAGTAQASGLNPLGATSPWTIDYYVGDVVNLSLTPAGNANSLTNPVTSPSGALFIGNAASNQPLTWELTATSGVVGANGVKVNVDCSPCAAGNTATVSYATANSGGSTTQLVLAATNTLPLTAGSGPQLTLTGTGTRAGQVTCRFSIDTSTSTLTSANVADYRHFRAPNDLVIQVRKAVQLQWKFNGNLLPLTTVAVAAPVATFSGGTATITLSGSAASIFSNSITTTITCTGGSITPNSAQIFTLPATGADSNVISITLPAITAGTGVHVTCTAGGTITGSSTTAAVDSGRLLAPQTFTFYYGDSITLASTINTPTTASAFPNAWIGGGSPPASLSTPTVSLTTSTATASTVNPTATNIGFRFTCVNGATSVTSNTITVTGGNTIPVATSTTLTTTVALPAVTQSTALTCTWAFVSTATVPGTIYDHQHYTLPNPFTITVLPPYVLTVAAAGGVVAAGVSTVTLSASGSVQNVVVTGSHSAGFTSGQSVRAVITCTSANTANIVQTVQTGGVGTTTQIFSDTLTGSRTWNLAVPALITGTTGNVYHCSVAITTGGTFDSNIFSTSISSIEIRVGVASSWIVSGTVSKYPGDTQTITLRPTTCLDAGIKVASSCTGGTGTFNAGTGLTRTNSLRDVEVTSQVPDVLVFTYTTSAGFTAGQYTCTFTTTHTANIDAKNNVFFGNPGNAVFTILATTEVVVTGVGPTATASASYLITVSPGVAPNIGGVTIVASGLTSGATLRIGSQDVTKFYFKQGDTTPQNAMLTTQSAGFYNIAGSITFAPAAVTADSSPDSLHYTGVTKTWSIGAPRSIVVNGLTNGVYTLANNCGSTSGITYTASAAGHTGTLSVTTSCTTTYDLLDTSVGSHTGAVTINTANTPAAFTYNAGGINALITCTATPSYSGDATVTTAGAFTATTYQIRIGTPQTLTVTGFPTFLVPSTASTTSTSGTITITANSPVPADGSVRVTVTCTQGVTVASSPVALVSGVGSFTISAPITIPTATPSCSYTSIAGGTSDQSARFVAPSANTLSIAAPTALTIGGQAAGGGIQIGTSQPLTITPVSTPLATFTVTVTCTGVSVPAAPNNVLTFTPATGTALQSISVTAPATVVASSCSYAIGGAGVGSIIQPTATTVTVTTTAPPVIVVATSSTGGSGGGGGIFGPGGCIIGLTCAAFSAASLPSIALYAAMLLAAIVAHRQ